MNKVYIIGNLVREPESRTLPNGTNLCTFTVAVNQIKGDAQYFRVTTWRTTGRELPEVSGKRAQGCGYRFSDAEHLQKGERRDRGEHGRLTLTRLSF